LDQTFSQLQYYFLHKYSIRIAYFNTIALDLYKVLQHAVKHVFVEEWE
jgi:hypothetical protein